MQPSQPISLYNLLFEEDNAAPSADNAKQIGAVLKPIIEPIVDDTTKIKAQVATTNRNLNKLLLGKPDAGNAKKTTANTTPPNPGSPPTTLSTKGGEGGQPPKGADPATTRPIPQTPGNDSARGNDSAPMTLKDFKRLMKL